MSRQDGGCFHKITPGIVLYGAGIVLEKDNCLCEQARAFPSGATVIFNVYFSVFLAL
jgi:hypothetical protein